MAITDYLQHVLGSLFLACCYFIVQVDFNEDFKKQKKLYIVTGGVFVFALFLSYFLIRVPKRPSVSFGDNDVQEFDDDGSVDGDGFGDDGFDDDVGAGGGGYEPYDDGGGGGIPAIPQQQ